MAGQGWFGHLFKSKEEKMRELVRKKIYERMEEQFTSEEMPYLREFIAKSSFDSKRLVQIAKRAPREFICDCIENPNFGLGDEEKAILIKHLGDKDYTIACLRNKGLWKRQITDGVSSAYELLYYSEKDVLKKFLDLSMQEFPIDFIVEFVKETDDPIFIKKYIEKAQELGINDRLKSGLIWGTKDMDYIRQHFINGEIDTFIDLPEGMTIGIEIEFENGGNLGRMEVDGWVMKTDSTLSSVLTGREITSPIMTSNKGDAENIHVICNMIQQSGGMITEKCGGHIHIGAHTLSSNKSFQCLAGLWANTEKVLYIISNAPGEKFRGTSYAKPISGLLENYIPERKGEPVRISFDNMRPKGESSKYCGIKLPSLKKDFRPGQYSKDYTIEFRSPNGTIDPKTWIENINLFGGMVRAAEELAQITAIPVKRMTPEQRKKLEDFSRLCTQELSDEEKLSILLSLTVSEDKKRIYEERYEANSVLYKESLIDKYIAKKPINPFKIAKRTITSDNRAQGTTVMEAEGMLTRDNQRRIEHEQGRNNSGIAIST